MIKVRRYEPEDRKPLEELIAEQYKEMKMEAEYSVEMVTTTIGFFLSSPQSGYIAIILYKDKIVGYSIVLYQWKMSFSRIYLYIDEIFIKKQFRRYTPEINLMDFISHEEKIQGIAIKQDRLKNSFKRTFKTMKFEKDPNNLFVKMLN